MAENFKQVGICVVVLVGLPGSGKTTLCKTLKDFLQAQNNVSNVVTHVIDVCYDKIILANSFKWQEDTSHWKSARKDILKQVAELVRCLKSLDSYHSLGLRFKEELLAVKNCIKNTVVYVIIDDNMYYCSMRYEYYQLARLYNLSFCQLYVETSVADAMNRNSSRSPDEVVPNEVILRMSEKLEPPSPYNSWESMYLTVCEPWTTEKIKSIVEFLNMASTCKVTAVTDDAKMRAESRTICAASVAHQADVALRRLVGEKMKQCRQMGLSSTQLECRSKLLSDVKHRVMEGIKTGGIAVPQAIQELVEQQSSAGGSALRNFLEEFFNLHQL